MLAAISTLIVPGLLSGVSEAISYWSGMSNNEEQWLFLALFLTQIVLLIYAIGIQQGSWLRPSSIAAQDAAQDAAVGTIDAPVQWAMPKAGFVSSTKSLLWQTFRFHWMGSLIALLVSGLYLVTMLSGVNTLLISAGYEAGSLTIEIANDLFAALIGGATGLFLFSKDQAGHSFRFFQQRADYPRRIWFARIINVIVIGLIVIAAVYVINLVLYSTLVAFSQSYKIALDQNFDSRSVHQFNFYGPVKSTEWLYYSSLTLRSATMFFVVAAVGQLVSIFCRHGILNALFGIIFCTMATIWVRYVNWYQVPAWSLALPIGIAALGSVLGLRSDMDSWDTTNPLVTCCDIGDGWRERGLYVRSASGPSERLPNSTGFR